MFLQGGRLVQPPMAVPEIHLPQTPHPVVPMSASVYEQTINVR